MLFIDAPSRSYDDFLSRSATAFEHCDSFGQNPPAQSIGLAQRNDVLGRKRTEFKIGGVADGERNPAIFGIECCGDEIIGRREA